MLLLLFSVSLPFVFSQTCSDPGIGLCVGDICPPGFTCIDKGGPGETCCDDTKIVTATTTTTTTTTPAPTTTTAAPSSCVDLLNPNTGVSDCPNRAYLCQNSIYYDLMTQQCPKTCNRCPSTGGGGTGGGTGTTCVDKLNPLTGVSDCPQRTTYCNNQIYYDLMTDQCPLTCGRCSISGGGTTGGTGGTTGTCEDKINPMTGTSDCPMRTQYCTNQIYYQLMTDQCPLTCGRCSTTSGTGTSGGTTGGTGGTIGSCVDKINPSTGVSDCPQRTQYCNDAIYYSLMTDQCPLTCGRCSG